jgi:hypothetical protein
MDAHKGRSLPLHRRVGNEVICPKCAIETFQKADSVRAFFEIFSIAWLAVRAWHQVQDLWEIVAAVGRCAG